MGTIITWHDLSHRDGPTRAASVTAKVDSEAGPSLSAGGPGSSDDRITYDGMLPMCRAMTARQRA